MSDFLRLVQQRALATGDPRLLQVGFEATVLDRYRGRSGFRVMRTDTVGRVQQDRGWSIDFGISPGGETIHTSWDALAAGLPEGERERWASHAAPVVSFSDMFLRMQLSPSSCFDDGELRDW